MLPITDNQTAFYYLSQNDKTNMIFLNGPAGSAKSYIAVYTGLELLKNRKIDKIIYIRSVVESSSRSIGSLPGELDDKFMPYAAVCLEKASEIVDKSTLNSLLELEYIKTIPVNFVRGLTFNNALVIVDEAQNLNKSELITILTRFGKNSKYIISGDLKQSDIRDSGFGEIFNKFDTEFSRKNDIHCVNFNTSDIVRSQILKHITAVLGV
jgi:phosphate starvation-inducible PhoH-like protein